MSERSISMINAYGKDVSILSTTVDAVPAILVTLVIYGISERLLILFVRYEVPGSSDF